MRRPGSAALPRVAGAAPSPGMDSAGIPKSCPREPPTLRAILHPQGCIWGPLLRVPLHPGCMEPLNRRAPECLEQCSVPAAAPGAPGPWGDLGVTVPQSPLAEPRLTLASLSERMEGENRSENGAWGKPEQSVGSEGALGKQSRGRAGQSLPTAPSTTKAPLSPLLCSTPLPSQPINHKVQLQGKGEGQTVHNLPARAGAQEPQESPPCPGLGLGEQPGWGWPQPRIPAPAPSPVPLRCHSHGHRWTGH